MATVNTFKIPSCLQASLRAAGVDLAVLLRKSRLPLALWSSGREMVTTEQYFALWRALGKLSDDPAIGLKLARLIPREQHHPVSIAAQHARTFRDALQRWARYQANAASAAGRIQAKPRSSRDSRSPLWLPSEIQSASERHRFSEGRSRSPLHLLQRRTPRDAWFATGARDGGAEGGANRRRPG